MKQLALASFYVCFLSVLVFSQAKPTEKDQSNLEKFSARSGTLIEKKFLAVGTVKGIEIQVLVLTDMINTGKISGVRFEYKTASRYSTDTKIAFLDQDEVDGLIKSINIIKTKVFPTKPDSYTEVVFTSRSGFSAGCYYNDSKWSAFVKVERFDRDSNVFFQSEDLESLLRAVLKIHK